MIGFFKRSWQRDKLAVVSPVGVRVHGGDRLLAAMQTLDSLSLVGIVVPCIMCPQGEAINNALKPRCITKGQLK